MPAKDAYHNAVVNALEADGWQILEDPFQLRMGKRYLFPDLLIWREDMQQVVVEIKGFDDAYSAINQLIEAIGQYMLYRSVLSALGLNFPIYLAIPVVQ